MRTWTKKEQNCQKCSRREALIEHALCRCGRMHEEQHKGKEADR